VGRVSLAVDEKGDLYMAFSIIMPPLGPGRPNEEPKLVKYDKNGRLISVFPLPDFLLAHPGGLVYLGSAAISQDKIYVPVHWRDKKYVPRKSILIYTKAGRYKRSIDIPGRFYPQQVVVSPTGALFVLGSGARQVDKRFEHAGTDMIIKLSPSSEVLTSFSPFPLDPDIAEDLLKRRSQNRLLLDNAGHLIHVLPDATIRVFDLDGRWLKTLSPILPVRDYLYSVVRRDGMFVFSTVDRLRGAGYQAVVSAEGEVVSWTEISGESMIEVQGRDGNYYAISRLPRRAPSDPPELQISKMRLELLK
jgi:hypothetical protein